MREIRIGPSQLRANGSRECANSTRSSSRPSEARAGIHTPCPIVFGAEAKAFCLNEGRWLWVPAFAGTTKEDSIVKQQTRLRAPRRDAPELCI